MSNPPRVFISATSTDLRSVRKLATDAVLTMGCLPVSQDHFQPGYGTVKAMLEEKIQSCQALIHIVGHRYGAEPDPAKLPAGVPRLSYTQMEYELARNQGIKTYVFVCPENFPYDDTGESEPEELRQLQEAHRAAILTGERLYTSVQDRDAVMSSVQQLQLELGELRGKVERGKRSLLAGIAALLLVLILIGAGVFWMLSQSGRQSAALSEIQGKLDSDRKLMLAVLAKAKESQLADSSLTPADQLKSAIAAVAAEQSLSPEEVQASMSLFASSVEAGKKASPFDAALVAMGMRDFKAAVAHARKAVAAADKAGTAEGRPAEAYSLLGDALLASQHFDEAAEAYRKAASLVDGDRSPGLLAKLVSWTGSSLERAGKPDEAEAFRRSMMQGPGGSGAGTGVVVMSGTGEYGIKGPPSTPAGAAFAMEIVGTVPEDAELLAIFPKGEATTSAGNGNSKVVQGKKGPFELSAPMAPGSFEVRYLSRSSGGGGRRILALFPIEVTAIRVSVVAPKAVGAGSSFEVVWTGPNGQGDFVTLVSKGTEAGAYKDYAYTKSGNPVKIRAQETPGDYEVRYLSGTGNKTLAVAAIQVTAVPASLKAVSEVAGGTTVKVEWTGPANRGDFVTVVDTTAEAGAYNHYVNTESAGGKPVEIRVPEQPGNYEFRYVTAHEKRTLATAPIRVTAIQATVSAAPEVVAGAGVEVNWTGPAHTGDFITIVAKDAKDKEYKNYVYTKGAEPLIKVLSMDDPGEAEVRYLTAGGQVVARQGIRIREATAQLVELPPEVKADERIQLKWKGPDNRDDLIVFALPDDNPSAYKTYIYCRNGQENNKIQAPREPGTYELRYVTGQSKKILARSQIQVK